MARRELRGAMAAFYACTDREILIEGRAGTSKTTGIVTKILRNCRKYPGSRHLICRQTRESLTESVMVTFERVLGEGHPEVVRVKREQRHNHRLWGSEVVWGGLDKPAKLFSTEWDTVYVPEATEISEAAWELFGRAMRNNRMPYQQRVADCNPDYPGHWLNKRAFPCNDRLRDVNSPEDYNRLQDYNAGPQLDPATGKAWKMRRLVSVHQDNPGYWDIPTWSWTPMGRQYVEEELGAMTGSRRERMARGRWVAAQGTVYPEFEEKHIINPFPVPGDWPTYAWWDAGYDHPTAIVWVAIAPNGCHYVIDEIYRGGLSVAEHCKNFLPRCAGRDMRKLYGDPQHCFSQTAQAVVSIAQQAKAAGVTMVPGPRTNDAEAMVEAVRRRLIDGTLKVFSTCTNTIDEFQSWRYKRNAKGEPLAGDDKFEDANNHAMDGIKGLVALKLRHGAASGARVVDNE